MGINYPRSKLNDGLAIFYRETTEDRIVCNELRHLLRQWQLLFSSPQIGIFSKRIWVIQIHRNNCQGPIIVNNIAAIFVYDQIRWRSFLNGWFSVCSAALYDVTASRRRQVGVDMFLVAVKLDRRLGSAAENACQNFTAIRNMLEMNFQSDKYISIQYHGFETLRDHTTSQWRQNGRDGVTNQLPHDCLLNRLFRYRSKKTSKLRVTGLCAGNSPVTCEFPAQMASRTENVSIWWRHHDKIIHFIL